MAKFPFKIVRNSKNFNSVEQNITFTMPALPVYLNFGKSEDYIDAYNCIPEANAIINYMASAFSNAKVQLENKDGEIIEEGTQYEKVSKLFNDPNPLQAQSEFLKQYYAYMKITGNSFTYGQAAYGMGVSYDNIDNLWNLPSQYMAIVPTGKIFSVKTLDDIISKYVLNIGVGLDFRTENIMHKNDINVDFTNGEYLLGQSRLRALRKPLSNIVEAYQARNVVISKRGALGILSTDSGAGNMPLNPLEIEELQKKYQDDYGLSAEKFQMLITSANVKWDAISPDFRSLELYKETEADRRAVADGFNFPLEIMSNEKSVTFVNKKEADKKLYQNAIIPDANDIGEEFTKFLKLDIEGYKIKFDYSHVPVLQTDQKEEADKDSTNTETIIKLNTAVADKKMSRESAISVLINTVGVSEKLAEEAISEPIPTNEGGQNE